MHGLNYRKHGNCSRKRMCSTKIEKNKKKLFQDDKKEEKSFRNNFFYETGYFEVFWKKVIFCI